jgi:chromosomal replication initiation ATPase DnaA
LSRSRLPKIIKIRNLSPHRRTVPIVRHVEAKPPEREVYNAPGVIGLIKKVVCKYFDVRKSDIESERRGTRLVKARHLAFWLAREMTSRSFPDIGRQFGGRDHTTVLHGVRKIDGLIETDESIAKDLDVLRQCVKDEHKLMEAQRATQQSGPGISAQG